MPSGPKFLAVVSSKDLISIGNLFVSSGSDQIWEDLRKQLIDVCREEGKEFGLLVKVLERPGIPRGLSTSFALPHPGQKPAKGVLVAYKVHLDGLEEPVRVGAVSGMDIRVLREIMGASQSAGVYNFLAGDCPLVFLGPQVGIPSAIVPPAVLVRELDFQKPEIGKKKPPHLPHPYFK